jgi:hypothetical protein
MASALNPSTAVGQLSTIDWILGSNASSILPIFIFFSVTPNIAEKVLQEISTEKKMKIGKIEDAFEPSIQSIVDNWPTAVDGFRAEAIGLPKPPSLKKIIEQYLELIN